MCGLIGLIDSKNVNESIVDNLYKLQYRGYDSYGFSVVEKNQLHCYKKIGPVHKNFFGETQGNIGIGHTRWATNGKVTLNNTHPIQHLNICIAQNGIIDNADEIRKRFPDFPWKGETDTESCLPLFAECTKFDMKELQNILSQLEGSFVILCLNADTEEIYVLKKGINPVFIAIDGERKIISSDVKLLTNIDQIIELDNEQCAILSINKIDVYPNVIKYSNIKHSYTDESKTTKTWFEHEFLSQPSILRGILNKPSLMPNFIPTNMSIVGCGSSYLAGTVGSYWLRDIAKISSNIYFSSEYQYFPKTKLVQRIDSHVSCLAVISQSGETLDTLNKAINTRADYKIGFINNPGSIMEQYVDFVIPTSVGRELSVASTKSTSGQLLSLLQLACHFGERKDILDIIPNVFDSMELLIKNKLDEIMEVAKLCINKKNIFIVATGYLLPIAYECALKIKELSYINVEGMCSSELKHGPLAVIDKDALVICFSLEKTAIVEEILSRGGSVVVFGPNHVSKTKFVEMDEIDELLSPFLYILVAQWLGYCCGILVGNSIDMPRNLAKSVTVY